MLRAPWSPSRLARRQLLIAVVVCLAYLLGVTHAAPFRGYHEDRLAFVVSLCLTLSLVLGLAIIMDDPAVPVFDMPTMGVLLIVINALPIILLLVYTVEIYRFGPYHKLVAGP